MSAVAADDLIKTEDNILNGQGSNIPFDGIKHDDGGPIHLCPTMSVDRIPPQYLVKREDQEMDLGQNPVGMLDDEHQDEKKPELPRNVQLQQLFEGADMKTLENGIKNGLSLLDNLTEALTSTGISFKDAEAWMKQIEDIKKLAEYQKAIVGVVGNTGAGKSSVINALLEEERLVPTNCMRACTAVVTEISYNNENGNPYRASIEFITATEWEKELRVLFQDLMDGSGEVKNKISPESVSLQVLLSYFLRYVGSNCFNRRQGLHGLRLGPFTPRRQRRCSGRLQ